jgi:hypothetical protein
MIPGMSTPLTAPGMTRAEWLDYLVVGGTRYVPSRCCGRTVYYWEPGDEWCDEHRCDRMTSYGWRCERPAKYAHQCGQHFSQGIRELVSVSTVLTHLTCKP